MVIFFVLLLSMQIAFAITTNKPRPIISVTFNEPITPLTIQHSLKNVIGNEFDISEIERDETNTIFKYQPDNNLPEETYIFSISATDIHGNSGNTQTQTFTVQVTDVEMFLNVPSFGVSSTETFNLEIET